jgi:hypothetical protein
MITGWWSVGVESRFILAIIKLDTYSHLWPNDEDRAVDASFDGAMSSSCHDEATG